MIRMLFGLFLAALALAGGLAVARAGWWTLPALVAGWYLADMLSGLIHMTLDYYPCPLGKGIPEIYFYPGSRESADYLAKRAAVMARLNAFERVVFDFKTHHPRPDALGRRPLLVQIGPTLVLALPAALVLDGWGLWGHAPGWIMALGTALLAGSGFAQYFHGSLHVIQVPRHVAIMRRLGLLMTPDAHQRHHDTLTRDFATNCGWSNPLVNALFAALRQRGHLPDSGLDPSG